MAKELNVERFKKTLLREQERLRAEAKTIASRSSSEDESSELGELADYDNHPADAATNTFEREKDLALDENVDDLLDKIDDALDKIEEGTYGKCDRCGRDISVARLEVLPYATLCVDCQDMMEGR
jgi:RNA polymerase-binding protein DksA